MNSLMSSLVIEVGSFEPAVDETSKRSCLMSCTKLPKDGKLSYFPSV